MSVDVEIYLSNIIKFFKQNPNELLSLVPKDKEQKFYSKIKEVAYENEKQGNDVTLTQKQLIDICRDLNSEIIIKEIPANFMQTKFGLVCLN